MKRIVIIGFVSLFLVPGCLLVSPAQSDTAWMAYTPIQCLGNPWEQDWLDRTGGEENYPNDEDEINAVIQTYYAREGVTIRAISRSTWGGAVCLACSCPAGYTLYVLVSEDDVETMEDLGFQPSTGIHQDAVR